MFYAKDIKAYYFELSTTSEIDFIIQDNGVIIPFKIESGLNIKPTSFTNFIKKKSNVEKGIRFSKRNISINELIEDYPLYTFEWLIK